MFFEGFVAFEGGLWCNAGSKSALHGGLCKTHIHILVLAPQKMGG